MAGLQSFTSTCYQITVFIPVSSSSPETYILFLLLLVFYLLILILFLILLPLLWGTPQDY